MDTVLFVLFMFYFVIDAVVMSWRLFGGRFENERISVSAFITAVVVVVLQIMAMYILCSHSAYTGADLWFGIFVVAQIVTMVIMMACAQAGRLATAKSYSFGSVAFSVVAVIMTTKVYMGI